ncbi:hypothetical protein EJMOOK_13765 [Rhodanobacter sp. Root179]|uniref:hypothetical protein n=1 Tax=Rhodanobacter sp. Root179 TaxID=1736482 RepID=UPI000B3089EF|nr:hypothetical protein [Rhodanobacter sp. Root179]
MPKFQVGDRVYVPASVLPEGDRDIFAMRRCEVVAASDRSIQVRLPYGTSSQTIGSSKAHHSLGIALVSIGDFQSEDGLINPLSKSLLQFCRLLLPDDHISSVKIRAIGEFGEWWAIHHAAYTHIILIGHGDKTAIYFGVGGARLPISFDRRLSKHNTSPKLFVSLCCETGKAPFARDFSKLPFCRALIAPEKSIHGAVASQYLQTFLSLHLLQGKSTKIAFNISNSLVPGNDRFAMWAAGTKRK